MNFVSLDLETANPSRVSICAAGITVFENGERTESLYWLVRPPSGQRWFREDFTALHGLTWNDVKDAPAFPGIATDLLARLTKADLVVAHNASFDMGALYATLVRFGLLCPAFEYACTCQLARRVWPELPNHRLDTLAAHIGLEFKHHHAQADAETAGRVLLAMMKQVKAGTPRELLQKTGMKPKRF